MKKLLVNTAIILALTATSGFAASQIQQTADNKQISKQEMVKKIESEREAILAKLPADKAAMVRAAFVDIKNAGKDSYKQSKALREELKTILKADKFDAALYTKKSAELKAIYEKKAAVKQKKLIELASQFNAEERAVLDDVFTGMRHKKFNKTSAEHKKCD